MSSSADRTRRWRERLASGRLLLEIEVNEQQVEVLITHGMLDPNFADHRDAIARAVEKTLDALTRDASRHGIWDSGNV
jgi:hypothetical protein